MNYTYLILILLFLILIYIYFQFTNNKENFGCPCRKYKKYNDYLINPYNKENFISSQIELDELYNNKNPTYGINLLNPSNPPNKLSNCFEYGSYNSCVKNGCGWNQNFNQCDTINNLINKCNTYKNKCKCFNNGCNWDNNTCMPYKQVNFN